MFLTIIPRENGMKKRERKETKELPPVYGFSRKTLEEWADNAFEKIKRKNPAQGELFS